VNGGKVTVTFTLLALALAGDPQTGAAGNGSAASSAGRPVLAQQSPPSGTKPSRSPSAAPAPAPAPAAPPSAKPPPAAPPAAKPSPAAPPSAKPSPKLVADVPRAQQAPRRFRVGLRAGSFVPRTELAAGPFVALEGGYLLPFEPLHDRLRLSLSVGFISVAQRSQKTVPGRGYDQGFLQRTRIVPIELSATWDILLASPGTPGLSAGAGYGLYPTSTEFTAFNTPTTERAVGQAGFALVRGSLPLWTGLVFLDVRYAEARASLGPMGNVGTSDLSGFTFAAGYSLDL
jgi:hypothetical protein